MNVTKGFTKWREVLFKEPRRPLNLPRDERCEALDKSSIAELSAALIDSMTCGELVQMICASKLPILRRSNLHGRLAFYDRETLVRLAHLARQCCQNQGY